MFIRLKIPKLVQRFNAIAYSDNGIFYASFPSFLNAIFHRPFIYDGVLLRIGIHFFIYYTEISEFGIPMNATNSQIALLIPLFNHSQKSSFNPI